MKTVDEVVKELNEIDKLFKGQRDLLNCLKIDLFCDVDNKTLYDALRQTDISSEDFFSIVYTRHKEGMK